MKQAKKQINNKTKSADTVHSMVRTSCCSSKSNINTSKNIDWMLLCSSALVVMGYTTHIFSNTKQDVYLHNTALIHFTTGTFELINSMWWGIILGIISIGLLDQVPRDIIIKALAGKRRTTGILRAIVAGLFFDLCSHGVLMIGMKMYERGATIGQTVAFLLASPWNSISLTVILVSLIGLWYTIVFVILSGLIAFVTGWTFDTLVARNYLPENPARMNIGTNLTCTTFPKIFLTWVDKKHFSWRGCFLVVKSGLAGSRIMLRWLLFGVVIASTIRAVIPTHIFSDWFGPTLVGITITAATATAIEVCSEGSAPIAADLMTKASSPGNSFTFLMAGVATDYTEVMCLKDTTRSWKIALALPLVTVPQVLVMGIMLNYYS
ncbi:MAG: hypothetical protein TECD_01024 [Hyphomicrobiaceae bacterium hypho_1]